MSLYGMLRTGVSGMNAQSNKLGTIADNIGNSGTAGYKRASTEFSSLLIDNTAGQYNSGAVNTSIRYAISQQGAPNYTTSGTDLMIQGNGFFMVQDNSGQSFLTRAGSFTKDASTGNLVNTAGYTLMGYDISNGPANVVLNSTANQVPVDLSAARFDAVPSTLAKFAAKLPLPATPGGAIPNQTSSITAYDNLGTAVKLDITFVYTAGAAGPPATIGNWTMNVAGGTLPVAQPLTFNGNGDLTVPAAPITIAIPNGQPLSLDISDMTRLEGEYEVSAAEVNGNPPSLADNVVIDDNGIVSAIDPSGRKRALYQIPIATVGSPDRLEPGAGNVFQLTTESGNFQVGFPNEGGAGYVISGATEASNVDMATELTEMIVAQRDYTANSKVVQTGSELLDVLMNLKR